MYKETGKYLRHIIAQKSIWKDGELWSSVVIALSMFFWFRHDPSVMNVLKEQLGDVLTVSSIVFGFVMTILALHVEMSFGWSKERKVQKVVGYIIDWQVWSILWLIVQIAYVGMLRLADGHVNLGLRCRPLWFSILIFLTAYAGCQIWNHALVIWWTSRDPQKFAPKPDEGQKRRDEDANTEEADCVNQSH